MGKLIAVFTMVVAISASARAEMLISGGTSGVALCHFLAANNVACTSPSAYVSLSDEEVLEKVRNEQIAVGIVPADLIKEDDKAYVLFYTSPLRKRLLVASSKASKEDVSAVMKLFYDNFGRQDNFKVPQELLGNVERPREMKPLISFRMTLPLHPGIAMYYESYLDKSKSIAYGSSHCNRKTGECTSTSDSPNISRGIAPILADVGLPMVPYLQQWLKSPVAAARAKAAYALGDIYPPASNAINDLLQALTRETDDDAREEIIVALGNFEQTTPEIIAALVTVIQQTPVKRPDFSTGSRGLGGAISVISLEPASFIAAKVLAKVDPEAVEQLSPLLQSKDVSIQLTAVKGLAEIVRLDNDQWRSTRLGQFPALNDFKPASRKAIEILQQALHFDSSEVRKAAVFALTPYGEPTANADVAAELQVQLKDETIVCGGQHKENCYHPVRVEAMYAIRGIAKFAANTETINQLASIIETSSGYERKTALETLAVLAKHITIPPELIAKIMIAKPTEQETNYIQSIGKLASESGNKDMLGFLLKQLSDDSGSRFNRAEAAKTLAKMVKEKPELASQIIPALIQSTQNEVDETIRRFKLEALADCGALAIDAVPMLRTYANYKPDSGMEDDKWIRSRAVMALGQIGQATPEVRDAIINALHHVAKHPGENQLLYDASYALLKLFPEDDRNLEVFLELLKAHDMWTKLGAMESIAKMGPRAKAAVDDLAVYVRKADNKNQDSRNYGSSALKTLQAIGTPEALAIIAEQKFEPPPKVQDWEVYLNAFYKMQGESIH